MRTPQTDYEEWINNLSLARISRILDDLYCTVALVKVLSPNDNSKNQPWLGSDLSQVSQIPSGEPVASIVRSRKPRAHGKLNYQLAVDLRWVTPTGEKPAPQTKLIFYPQYPEVRLSGFLAGCEDPPSFLFNSELRGREEHRVLILGITQGTAVFALALPPESSAARELRSRTLVNYGVMKIWDFRGDASIREDRSIFAALCTIQAMSWMKPRKLTLGGAVPHTAPNSGGVNLETLLGIMPNSTPGPDFGEWEIKGHHVNNLDRIMTGKITLFTPEPDGGFYVANGAEAFLLRYGHSTIENPDRMDFASAHRVSMGRHPNTRLKMSLDVSENAGKILLEDDQGENVASWSFEKLLGHWKTKHNRAIYVPYMTRGTGETKEHAYGLRVLMAEHTSFMRFLEAVELGKIYYDPGINMKRRTDGSWQIHKRNQFRANMSAISCLYETCREVESCALAAGAPI